MHRVDPETFLLFTGSVMVSAFQSMSDLRSQASRFTITGTLKDRKPLKPCSLSALSAIIVSTAKTLCSVSSEQRRATSTFPGWAHQDSILR